MPTPKKTTQKKTKTKKKKEQHQPTRQLVTESEFSCVLNTEEMIALIQILSFSKDIFDNMAVTAMKEKATAEIQKMYATKAQASFILFQKFRDIANIGEPKSRDVH